MSSPAANPKLDYAPPPKWHRRQWFRLVRWAVLALILAAVLRYGPGAFHRARATWTERACLSYCAPPGQVVCKEQLPYAGQTPPFSFEASEPPCVGALRPLLGMREGADGPVLFAHERQTPGGLRRLVILRRTPPDKRSSWDLPLSYTATVLDPSLISASEPRVIALNEVVGNAYGDGTASDEELHFLAGQADPADPAHFTINYNLRGKSGTIDGWLMEGTTDLKLTERFGQVPLRPDR